MSLEIKIRNLFNEGRSVDEVMETLLDLSASPKISKMELHSIAQFFVISGYHKEFFRQFPRRFSEKKHIAWLQFTEILLLNNIQMSQKIINAIYEGVSQLNTINNLALNKKWTLYDDRLVIVRKKIWGEKLASLIKVKDSLKQKIAFYKSNRLVDEEKKSYQKYLKLFPTDSSIEEEYKEFKERIARSIVNKKMETKGIKEITHNTTSPLSSEESQLADIIYKECEHKIVDNPNLGYDLAIMFVFFEQNHFALKLFETLKPELRVMLLKLEVLVLARDFFSALAFIDEIEDKFNDNGEISFALVYAKAKIFISLKQKSRAASLLKSIQKVRPNYRSVNSLLQQVMGDEE
jgi:hypothetical protein